MQWQVFSLCIWFLFARNKLFKKDLTLSVIILKDSHLQVQKRKYPEYFDRTAAYLKVEIRNNTVEKKLCNNFGGRINLNTYWKPVQYRCLARRGHLNHKFWSWSWKKIESPRILLRKQDAKIFLRKLHGSATNILKSPVGTNKASVYVSRYKQTSLFFQNLPESRTATFISSGFISPVTGEMSYDVASFISNSHVSHYSSKFIDWLPIFL